MSLTWPFSFAICTFGPLSRALADDHLERGGMQLHDVVGVNSKKKMKLLKIKEQVPGNHGLMGGENRGVLL